MNYFYDLEFLEGKQDKTFMGIKYGKTPPTIDLISIGIVSDDNREYYAISKDFNLKEAWNRYDIKIEQMYGDARNTYPEGRKTKVYWIRENVLAPIYNELANFHISEGSSVLKVNSHFGKSIRDSRPLSFSYKNLKWLIETYGKSNKKIAEEIKDFISMETLLNKKIVDHYGFTSDALRTFEGRMACIKHNWGNPQFYGYYSAYDHVVLCWLFGKMIDLPDGFPMYSIDLKQTFDEKFKELNEYQILDIKDGKVLNTNGKCYPKQTNEHNSLQDAKFNLELYKFLQTI